jgi:hypothetical protein
MICPDCGGEFRGGILQCPDCDVPLIAPPPAAERHHPAAVELVRTANVPLLAVLKSLLESAAIPYAIQGEEALRLVTVLPSSHDGTPEAFGVRLTVPEDRYAEAVELLAALAVENADEVDEAEPEEA